MNGIPLYTDLLARTGRAPKSYRLIKAHTERVSTSRSITLPAFCFAFMCILALTLGVSLYVRAETPQEPHSKTALPDDVHFMLGTVGITWTYSKQDSMPFTEYHSVTSAHVASAISNKGPVRVSTADNGELTIATSESIPNTILSTRRYHDWTLVSVLQYADDPTRSHGVFKFCSSEEVNSRCVNTLLSSPDGVVSMTPGQSKQQVTANLVGIDASGVVEELLSLLTLPN